MSVVFILYMCYICFVFVVVDVVVDCCDVLFWIIRAVLLREMVAAIRMSVVSAGRDPVGMELSYRLPPGQT